MISTRLQRFIVSALLAAAVLAVYAPVARYDFIALDDGQYVKDNGYINHGFSRAGVKWVFENVVSGNWHPVTMLSHMADCEIYGPTPAGQHFTNILLHTADTVLLFWLLLAITERRKLTGTIASKTTGAQAAALKSEEPPSSFTIWPCALTAALFGLHPLHVESVAWISERKDVLSAFFALLTLWCYQRYTTNSKPAGKASVGFYVLALVSFALGLMSKSMLVTLPFVMLLLDFWPLHRFNPFAASKPGDPSPSPQRLILEKVPFFVLTAIFCFITLRVQKEAGAVVALKYFPLPARLANVMVAYAHYLGKTFWPHSLAMLYPYEHWSAEQITDATILFVGLSITAICLARRKPYIFVGWFWFVGMLIPVIGLVQVGLQAMADHYMYLPSIGIFMAVAWGLADVVRATAGQKKTEKSAHSQKARLSAEPKNARSVAVAIPAMTLIALAGLSVASAVQVRYWKNSETLFTHAVSVTGHNTVAHYILGALYDSQGKSDMAAGEFTAAIADDPGNVKARCGLAYILGGEGKLGDAVEQYETALRVAPDFAKAHFGLAEVLMKEHDFNQAMSEYALALQSNPDIPEAHYQLAALYSIKGDATSAISELEEAVQLAPDWPDALNNLAWMRATEQNFKLRDGAEAARLAKQAVALTGGRNPSTLDTLAAAYAETGQFADAATTAQMAVQIANAADETNLAEQIQSRLKLYQAQHAYRE